MIVIYRHPRVMWATHSNFKRSPINFLHRSHGETKPSPLVTIFGVRVGFLLLLQALHGLGLHLQLSPRDLLLIYLMVAKLQFSEYKKQSFEEEISPLLHHLNLICQNFQFSVFNFQCHQIHVRDFIFVLYNIVQLCYLQFLQFV